MTKTAEELFKDGYNCAQAVFCAHCEKYGMDFKTGAKLSAPFGGGMGRLREVCGAVSGMFLLLGLKEGYTSLDDYENKKDLYEKVQKLAKEFEKEFGSIICKELLGLPEKKDDPTPSKRDANYYHKRPCGEQVKFASELFERYVKGEI